jgi:chemotaxis regulatin CheY-phosphate phosphatase CheZ
MTPRQVRGFKYAIEPAYRRELWKLDATQQAVARAQREALAARDELRELQTALEAQASQLTSHWSALMDPRVRAVALSYLVHARSGVSRASAHVERVEATLDAALEDHRHSEKKVELTTRHRDACLREHLVAEERRIGLEADAQWIARRHWLGLQGRAE